MGSINIANQGGCGEYEKLKKKCFPTNIMHSAGAVHLDACLLGKGKKMKRFPMNKSQQ